MNKTKTENNTKKYKSGLLGYRLWNYELEEGNPGLYSIGYERTLWKPGINVATCHQNHTAPNPECECGFYAYNSIENPGDGAIEDSIGMIIGAVVASGNLLIHTDGFRAEKVVIAALYYPELDTSNHLSKKDLDVVSKDYRASLFSEKNDFLDYTSKLNCLTTDEL